MTCPRHSECSLYVDEMLFGAERQHFVEHLQQCPVCSRHIDTLAGLRQDLRAMPSPALGFDLAAHIGPRLGRPARRYVPGWLSWGMPGAAVALSLAAGVWLGGMLVGGATVGGAPTLRVFDPVPPGGLCAAPELCRITKGQP